MRERKPIPDWISLLRGGAWRERFDAVNALREIGPVNPEIIEVLVGALGDQVINVRRSAVQTLLRFGVLHKEVIPGMLAALEREEKKIPEGASVVINLENGPRSAGTPDAEGTLPPDNIYQDLHLTLEDMAVDEESQIREAAARARERLEPDHQAILEELVQAISSENPLCCPPAAETLLRRERVLPLALPLLLQAWKDQKPSVRRLAGEKIGTWLTDQPNAHRALIQAVQYKHPGARELVLGIALQAGQAMLPELMRSLGDETYEVRLYSAWLLGHLGSAAQDSEPALRAAVRDPYRAVRQEAALAWIAVATPLGKNIYALRDPLVHEYNSHLAHDVCEEALRILGDDAKTVLPALVELAKSRNEELCQFGHSALKRLTADEAFLV